LSAISANKKAIAANCVLKNMPTKTQVFQNEFSAKHQIEFAFVNCKFGDNTRSTQLLIFD
jgi:hypothetical protein